MKEGSPIHKQKEFIVTIDLENCTNSLDKLASFVKQKEEPTTETYLPTSDRTSIIFTLKHQVGALARALQVFQELGINVLHIELHSGNEKNESETVRKMHIVEGVN